jgi:PAS domain-containing protein
MASAGHGSAHSGEAENIRLVVDTIPALVWSTRADGSAEFFNRRWLEYTGLSAEQALDWGWKVAIHPDDLPRMLETFHEALNLGRSFEEDRKRVRDLFERCLIEKTDYQADYRLLLPDGTIVSTAAQTKKSQTTEKEAP